jgi:1,4-alpha-glucan branching enzyme
LNFRRLFFIMPQPLGRLCLILHGHLPYVLHHGLWPHGEAWLYEAAAETYLPLLQLLDELAEQNIHAGLTFGLTPILLEQLAHDHFKTGFVRYLHERIDRAHQDAKEFGRDGDKPAAALARRWAHWFGEQLAHFQKLKRDIPAAFARHFREGRIQILTSAATHAYLPLLLQDNSLQAQLTAGVTISEKHLGIRPRGLWLPECAYRPASQQWQPPVLYADTRPRPGLETWFQSAGLSHFFVDTHLLADAKPLALMKSEGVDPTSDALVFWDIKRGWGNPLEPVGVASEPRPPNVYAFARHPRVSEQVWSGVIGYPGAGEYLEFHRKHGPQGLRYHRVTSHETSQHQKAMYDPDLIAGKVYEHAHHFCSVVREVLSEYTAITGRIGTVVAPFDAELFGHWWFEGPRFLREVLLMLAHDGTVELATAEQALAESTLDKVVRLPEGSWGEGGHHHVWLNEQTRWLWEIEYRAEDRFDRLLKELPWQTNAEVQKLLKQTALELLLMQASDWPFVIHSRGAADYGITRFAGHATRFDRLATIAASVAGGNKIGSVEKTEIAEADAHDVVLGDVDLSWWEHGKNDK